MSLFGSLGLMGFDDDPFRMMGSRSMFGQMNRLMDTMMRDPFSEDPFFQGGNGSLVPSLLDPAGGRHNRMVAQAPRQDPFQPLFNPMALMNQMGAGNGPACHSFSSSSVMTMTTGPDGQPQVYQASSSTRQVPGGVKEVRQSVQDSRTGMRKMAIGHHIEDRAHVIEKEMKDGEMEERQELINLDEGDIVNFDSEFRHRTQQPVYGANALDYRPRHRATPSSPVHQQRTPYLPALPAAPSSYRRRARPHLAVTGESSSRTDDRQRHRNKNKGVRYN